MNGILLTHHLEMDTLIVIQFLLGHFVICHTICIYWLKLASLTVIDFQTSIKMAFLLRFFSSHFAVVNQLNRFSTQNNGFYTPSGFASLPTMMKLEMNV